MEHEISWAEIAARSGIDKDELEKREKTTTMKKDRRVAEIDWLQLRLSALLNGPTDVALTFVDYLWDCQSRSVSICAAHTGHASLRRRS
jgi:adenylosuccinate synthase